MPYQLRQIACLALSQPGSIDPLLEKTCPRVFIWSTACQPWALSFVTDFCPPLAAMYSLDSGLTCKCHLCCSSCSATSKISVASSTEWAAEKRLSAHAPKATDSPSLVLNPFAAQRGAQWLATSCTGARARRAAVLLPVIRPLVLALMTASCCPTLNRTVGAVWSLTIAAAIGSATP